MAPATAIASAPPLSKCRWQYSLRALFVSMTLVGIAGAGVAWHANRVARQRRAVEMVLSHGGGVHYDYQFDRQEALAPDAAPPTPHWISDRLGDDYFARVVSVNLHNTQFADEDLAELAPLASLRELDLTNTAVTDAGLPHLLGLPSLTSLSLADTRVTDAGLKVLERMPRLQRLNVEGTDVSHRAIRDLVDARGGLTVLH